MKNSLSVMKKMDQFFNDEDTLREFEELYVILSKSSSINKEKADVEVKIQHELYNWLNPRYFEKGITPRDTLIKLDATYPRSNQDLIRPY